VRQNTRRPVARAIDLADRLTRCMLTGLGGRIISGGRNTAASRGPDFFYFFLRDFLTTTVPAGGKPLGNLPPRQCRPFFFAGVWHSPFSGGVGLQRELQGLTFALVAARSISEHHRPTPPLAPEKEERQTVQSLRHEWRGNRPRKNGRATMRGEQLVRIIRPSSISRLGDGSRCGPWCAQDRGSLSRLTGAEPCRVAWGVAISSGSADPEYYRALLRRTFVGAISLLLSGVGSAAARRGDVEPGGQGGEESRGQPH